jgi:hypothetical protein
MQHKLLALFTLFAIPVCAQDAADTPALMKQLLQRMDTLEHQNRELVEEIHALRQQLDAQDHRVTAAASPQQDQAPIQDQVKVNERRISEQAQTKVEASQKFPISLNGMLLFNAFENSAPSENEGPGEYGLLAGPARSGATLRQTLLGFNFQGPSLPGGGKVNASALMDFWGGDATPGSNWFRLRRADISLDWSNRSFTVGQTKPLIAPYEPDSLAEVGIPPLAGAGNLWLWLPQARYEERLHFGSTSGVTGQIAIMQTEESEERVPTQYSSSLEQARPALEGRIAFWHKFDDTHRIEIGSGFHTSTTHVAGASVRSRIASLDWHFSPVWKIELTGSMYTGQNVASLGALGNGFTILRNGAVQPVHSAGSWAQMSLPITNRLTFNFFGGLEDDRGTYLAPYSVARNLTYASNLMYHLGPNVVLGLEGLQMRSRYFSGVTQLDSHYDLALGYLF